MLCDDIFVVDVPSPGPGAEGRSLPDSVAVKRFRQHHAADALRKHGYGRFPIIKEHVQVPVMPAGGQVRFPPQDKPLAIRGVEDQLHRRFGIERRPESDRPMLVEIFVPAADEADVIVLVKYREAFLVVGRHDQVVGVK